MCKILENTPSFSAGQVVEIYPSGESGWVFATANGVTQKVPSALIGEVPVSEKTNTYYLCVEIYSTTKTALLIQLARIVEHGCEVLGELTKALWPGEDWANLPLHRKQIVCDAENIILNRANWLGLG